VKTGKDHRRLLTALVLIGVLGLGSGCGPNYYDGWKTDKSRWLAPSKVIKSPEGPAPIRAIDRNIGIADQDEDRIAGSTLPKRDDFEYSAEDYRMGPGDILDVSVLNLYNEGLETILRRQVTESGYIDLPLLPDRMLAQGRTQDQLKDDIIAAYSPDILVDPTVAVTIIAQRQNTFSILGPVARTGQYNVVNRSMRLLEALSLAGGVTQTNIEYLYVIRQQPPRRKAPAKKVPEVPAGGAAPVVPKGGDAGKGDVPGAEQSMRPGMSSPPLMFAETADGPPPPKDDKAPDNKGGWVRSIKTGRWTKAGAPDDEGPDDPLKWSDADGGAVRVIAIDLKKLRSGDPTMNIVVKDKDVINIPELEIGEFYVGGEVNRPGVYSLTGRKITVKMAIFAAGNIGELGWPENSVLIRRIGPASEQIVPLNIEKIFRGEQNDLFLKPNDVIAVGTDIRAPFLAVIRNAFRLTYGFGFIYDRNFGATSTYDTERDSERFTRW